MRIHICVRRTLDWKDEARVAERLRPKFRAKFEMWNATFDMPYAAFRQRLKEIAQLNRKIKEIRNLEKTKANLIARMNIIQRLQESRPEIVHLFDELVETLPSGTYLETVTQGGKAIALQGRAQSNARVSAYMRNIEGSEWLGDATLKLIENKEKTGTGMSHFQLATKQVVPKRGAAK